MPPPRIPKAASGMVSIIADVVHEITRRQGTEASTSDMIRGMSKALRSGLLAVDYEFPKAVTDKAHSGPNAWDAGHREGFCRACAAIYLAVTEAMIQYNTVDPQT